MCAIRYVLAASFQSYLATSCSFPFVARSWLGGSTRSISCLLGLGTFLLGTKINLQRLLHCH